MYIPLKAYAQSKLAQILFTNYLDKYFQKTKSRVQIHAVHPGLVNTDLFNGTYLKVLAPWIINLFFKNAEQGAMPIVHACISSKLENKGGTYISNCCIMSTSDLAKSEELQAQLFKFTNNLLKIEEFGKAK